MKVLTEPTPVDSPPQSAATLTRAKAPATHLLWSIGSAAFLFIARALVVIYQLRFATHRFGQSYGGLIVLLNQITFYILLAELGLAAATTSLLFEPMHHGDGVRVKALITALQRSVRRIAYWLAPLSCLATVGLALWLRRQVPVSVLAPSILLTCASAIITFMALPYQSHFNASDRVPVRNIILAFGFVTKVLFGILLARAMHNFVGLPLGTALIGLIEFLAQRQFVVPLLSLEPVSSVEIAEAQAAIGGRAKFVLFHRIGYLFSYQSDYIILLLSSSLALLGYYAQYQYIYAGLLSFALTAGGTLTARTAKRQLTIGRDAFPHFYRQTLFYATVSATLCGLGFVLFAKPAIAILYHTDAVQGNVVVLFALILMLNIIKMNDDIWIDTTGTYSTGFYLPILEACTYVLLGLLFVHRYHMAGVLYAGIATNLLFSVVFKAFVIGRGVMANQLRSTLAAKLVNMMGAAAMFGGVVFFVVKVHGW